METPPPSLSTSYTAKRVQQFPFSMIVFLQYKGHFAASFSQESPLLTCNVYFKMYFILIIILFSFYFHYVLLLLFYFIIIIIISSSSSSSIFYIYVYTVRSINIGTSTQF